MADTEEYQAALLVPEVADLVGSSLTLVLWGGNIVRVNWLKWGSVSWLEVIILMSCTQVTAITINSDTLPPNILIM